MVVSRLFLTTSELHSEWHCLGLQEPEPGEGERGNLAGMHLPDRAGSSWWCLKANLTGVLLSQAAFPAWKSQEVLSAAGGSRSALPKQLWSFTGPKAPSTVLRDIGVH